MESMMELALIAATLLASLAVLIKSSDRVTMSAVRLARFFHISELAVGVILVAVATSLPELAVSVISATSGQGAISAGNVFGSNISNILLIFGIGAVMYGVRFSRSDTREIGLLLLLTTIISAYMVFHNFIEDSILGFLEGLVLLGIFVGYSVYSLRSRKQLDGHRNGKVNKKEALDHFLSFSLGILIVIISSAFVVDAAVRLSDYANLADSFIGATIIALGTSLPELSVFLQSLRKKRYGLALGNIIGSNVTNLTLVLGTAAVIHPIVVNLPVLAAALLFAVVANMLLLYIAAVNRRMSPLCGGILLALYAVYLVVIFGMQLQEL